MSAQPGISPPGIPLRAMTLGELLDAAVALLRSRARLLLGAAAVLAVAEQLVLAPLRERAGLSPPYFWPAGDFGGWWVTVAVGFGLEAVIITLLGALAARAAVPALLGRAERDRALWRGSRPLAVVPAAVLFGLLCGLGALAGFLPWIFAYGLFSGGSNAPSRKPTRSTLRTAPSSSFSVSRPRFTASGRFVSNSGSSESFPALMDIAAATTGSSVTCCPVS